MRAVAGGAARGARSIDLVRQSNDRQRSELFWVSGAGPGRSYGFVEAGEARLMSTFAGHAWRITAPQGNWQCGPGWRSANGDFPWPRDSGRRAAE